MKFHWPSRGRLLAFSLLVSTAAVAGTLAFSTASSASHTPAAPQSPLTGTISSILHSQGLEISRPVAKIGPHISEQAAVATARAQPIAPFKGVQQIALAHVT